MDDHQIIDSSFTALINAPSAAARRSQTWLQSQGPGLTLRDHQHPDTPCKLAQD